MFAFEFVNPFRRVHCSPEDGEAAARINARRALQSTFQDDTAEQRKLAWLKTIRPRISKGKSGFWWCISSHPHPDPRFVGRRQRIGSGRTPREAYDAWMAY